MGPRNAKKASTTRATAQKRKFPPGAVYFMIVLAIALVSLWIRTGFPIYVIGNAAYDDQLFVRLADSFHSGEWLGPYNQLTLVKGMVYSIFIAIAHDFSIPLKVAEHGVYLAACGLVAELIRRKMKNNYLALALFSLLAFNPVLWNNQLARVIREGLYVSECLALVVLFVMICFPPSESPLSGHRLVLLGRILLGASVGALGAAYWLTREEGIWILPSLGVVALMAALRIFTASRSLASQRDVSSLRSREWKAVALPLGIAVLVFLAGDFLISGLNYRHYGIFETNELRSRSFLRAYGAVTRIRHDHPQTNVLFPRDARERAYAVSSAARQLRPWLEGPFADRWVQISCSASKISPCPSEVLAGWFLWEFRGAVQKSGQSESAPEAARFYNALADQIDSACFSGAIPCLPERDSMSPPFRWEYLGQAVKLVPGLTKILLTLRDGPIGTRPSDGRPYEVSFFRKVVGEVSSTAGMLDGKRVIRGWVASKSGSPTLKLVSQGGHEYPFSINLVPATIAELKDPTVSAVRFQLQTDCSPQLCALIVTIPGSQPAGISLADLSSRQDYNLPAGQLGIEEIDLTDTDVDQLPQVRIASVLSWAYAIGLPILSVLGLVGFALAAVKKKWSVMPVEIWTLGAASAVAVGTRIALLSYISASSFQADNLLYGSPASTFVIILAVLGTYSGYARLSAEGRFHPQIATKGVDSVRKDVQKILDD
jgi:hypothetical protein